MTLRLNKLLSSRGIAARRKCDALIESGAVQVNGEVITAPGAHVDPDRDDIRVNGKRLPGSSVKRYFVLNKPVGMISTLRDPQGRRSLESVLPPGPRVFPIGRLDADTSGLLLLTNDGDFAHHLMHPRYGVEKFYRVVLRDAPTTVQLERLQRGVVFEPGVKSAPARVRLRDSVSRGPVIEIAIGEGRYRQVRRMCEAVGLEVVALHRWGYGPLRLGDLARGMWRELSESELAALRAAGARPKPHPGLARPRGTRRGAPRPFRAEGAERGERAGREAGRGAAPRGGAARRGRPERPAGHRDREQGRDPFEFGRADRWQDADDPIGPPAWRDPDEAVEEREARRTPRGRTTRERNAAPRPMRRARGGEPKRPRGETGPSRRTGGEPRPIRRAGSETRPSRRAGGEARPIRRAGSETRSSRHAGGEARPMRRAGSETRPSRRAGGETRPPRSTGGAPRPSRRTGGETRPTRRAGSEARPARRTGSGTRPPRGRPWLAMPGAAPRDRGERRGPRRDEGRAQRDRGRDARSRPPRGRTDDRRPGRPSSGRDETPQARWPRAKAGAPRRGPERGGAAGGRRGAPRRSGPPRGPGGRPPARGPSRGGRRRG